MSETPTTPPPGQPLNAFQQVIFKTLMFVLWLGRKLPDRPLYRTAFAIGAGLYLLLPERSWTGWSRTTRPRHGCVVPPPIRVRWTGSFVTASATGW